MEAGDGLLGYRLHRNGLNCLVTGGFEDRLGVCLVGLVAGNVRAHRVGWEENDTVALALECATPVMCRTARFHDDGCGCLRAEEGADPTARESMRLGDVARVV